MRQYYIADTKNKVRLRRTFNSLSKAATKTALLNARHPGRYQCGDWVEGAEVGIDKPREWRWEK